jgi:flagellar biosynthesis/type III secretory pathway chaperone
MGVEQTMTTRADIDANLSAQLACAENLAALLGRERSALLASDVAALETLTRDKDRHATELGRLGTALESMRAMARQPSILSLLQQLGVSDDTWSRLSELAARCLQANRDNAALLGARQQQIRSALQLLQPAGAQQQVYGRAGAAPIDFGRRSFGAA